MKKVFSLILALLMLCMTFVSCASNDEDNDGEITAEQTVIGDDGLVYDENGYLMDDLGTKDFEGKEINKIWDLPMPQAVTPANVAEIDWQSWKWL